MSAAILQLQHLASCCRNAHLYSCISHAHAALLYAQRGVLTQTIVSLGAAQRAAEQHWGSSDDPRALSVLDHVRQECKVALCAKLL